MGCVKPVLPLVHPIPNTPGVQPDGGLCPYPGVAGLCSAELAHARQAGPQNPAGIGHSHTGACCWLAALGASGCVAGLARAAQPTALWLGTLGGTGGQPPGHPSHDRAQPAALPRHARPGGHPASFLARCDERLLALCRQRRANPRQHQRPGLRPLLRADGGVANLCHRRNFGGLCV